MKPSISTDQEIKSFFSSLIKPMFMRPSPDQELDSTWSLLTTSYQQLNSTTSEAERKRLTYLINDVRVLYRKLTNIYQ